MRDESATPVADIKLLPKAEEPQKMDNDDIAELLRYQRMLKQGTYRAIDIVQIPRS